MKFVADSPGPLTRGWGTVPEGSALTAPVDCSDRAGVGLYHRKYGSRRRAASSAIELAPSFTDTSTCWLVSEVSCKNRKSLIEDVEKLMGGLVVLELLMKKVTLKIGIRAFLRHVVRTHRGSAHLSKAPPY